MPSSGTFSPIHISRARHPKSTGRELFDPAFIAAFVERCRSEKADASAGDIVATAVALTAEASRTRFADSYRSRFASSWSQAAGGESRARGCHRGGNADVTVRRFSELFFDGEAKEAVAFALLGYLHLAARARESAECHRGARAAHSGSAHAGLIDVRRRRGSPAQSLVRICQMNSSASPIPTAARTRT
jgi:1,6-anhydro-N-acetylmuramate kinase